MIWQRIRKTIEQAGEIAKNLLAVGALIAAIWAVIAFSVSDAPFQRALDTLSGGKRLGSAQGWVWLGEGPDHKNYKFILRSGEWVSLESSSVPVNGSLLYSMGRANVRDAAGPWGEEISYLVEGDCVTVEQSKVVKTWGWIRVTPVPCSKK